MEIFLTFVTYNLKSYERMKDLLFKELYLIFFQLGDNEIYNLYQKEPVFLPQKNLCEFTKFKSESKMYINKISLSLQKGFKFM